MAALRAAPLATPLVAEAFSGPASGTALQVRAVARIAPAYGIDVDDLVDTLCELGRVDRLGDLGLNGPLLASAGPTSLFHCLFGRDSIRMAMDLLECFPAVARATLLELARLQGARHNPRAEEEPGRILHEHRSSNDPHAARLGQFWDLPYYGAVDTTPQWVNLLAAYCARHGAAILAEPLLDRAGRPTTVAGALSAALGWIERRLDDPRGGGYLWVQRALPTGLRNQVFEDSGDSHYLEDGTVLPDEHAYAPVAVQGYTYDALLNGARLLEQSRRAHGGARVLAAARLRRRATALRRRMLAHFWQPDLDTFAQAVVCDARPRPVRVVSSAAGHLLASRILDGDELAPLRARLMARLAAPDVLAAAGVRTKSTTAARFRAGSYHNGSTWPMDTGVIADGVRRHGHLRQAADLERRILAGCAEVGGFPEFLRGDTDGSIRANRVVVDELVDGVPNRLEQPPQRRQGWTATRVWRILAMGLAQGTASPSRGLLA
jgi:glycogen debranching enzyme